MARIWRALPFRWVWVVAFALTLIGDVFPFSPFPMYSYFSRDAQVLYLANADDEVIPMQKISGVRTSVAKKIYKRELKEICKSNGRKSSQATDADREQAGLYLIDYILEREKPRQLRKYTDGTVTLKRLLISLENDELTEVHTTIATTQR